MKSRLLLLALALSLSAAFSRAEIQDGLAGLWPLDESNGQIAADASAFQNDAQALGFTSGSPWTGGKISGAAAFGGPDKSQFLLVTNYPKSTGLLTVSAWAWADAAAPSATIARNGGGSVPGQFQIGLLDAVGGLQANIAPPTGSQITVREGAAFPLGAWQHVALILDGQQLMLFRNGAMVAATAYSGTLKTNGASGLGIGARLNPTSTDADPITPGFWQGKLDEVAIWNRALDPQEISALYSAGLAQHGVLTANAYLAPGSLQISEFMASNAGSLKDEDGDSPDWIELFNGAATNLNLQGWFLTDDPKTPEKWGFPSTNMAAKARMLVFASGKNRRVPGQPLHASFSLRATGQYLSLTNPAAHLGTGYSPSYPPQVASVSYGTLGDDPENPANWRYFTNPTPRRVNLTGVAIPGPRLENLMHIPAEPNDTEDVWVSVKASPFLGPIKEVLLNYRIMFSNEVATAMFDDGSHHDGAAGDGMYGAMIPANSSQPGEMIRYRVTALDTSDRASRWPLNLDPLASAQYQGTVVQNLSLTNALPVLHWFVQNKPAAETGTGTRCSVFYGHEFYDNIFVRIRGGTSRSWPKHSYKMEFNENEPFLIHPNVGRVSEINLNTTYTDKSYVRAIMHYELQRDTGLPSPETFAIRMQQNGIFYSVALFTEQPDADFLRRSGLDSEGALYKCGPGSTYEALGSFEKKTRRTESMADLQALITGLKLGGAALENFVFDNLDVPMMVAYMASTAIAQNIDASDKNHFIYRDTRGTGEWFMLPWDLDLSFGPNALNTDAIVYNQNYASHPFLGVRPYTLDSPSKYNRVLEAMFKVPRAREMVIRRIRTLTEEYLVGGYFSNRIDQWLPVLSADVDLDKAKWKTQGYFSGNAYTLLAANNRIKTEYLSRRAPYLMATNIPGITTNNVTAQPADAAILFGALDFNPASGNQDEEYLELLNTNSVPIDLTGWRVEGGIQHAFKPSTVIPSNSSLYLAANAAAFRTRAIEPRGGQGRFVQGSYTGRLSARGGSLRLIDKTGRQVSALSYAGSPTPAQSGLRVVEIMYHPAVLPGDQFPADEYEYIALRNISGQPLNTAAIRFTQGIQFEFNVSGIVNMAPGSVIYIVKNRAAFVSRYGAGVTSIGDYSGQLSNSGDTLELVDGSGEIVHRFAFGDKWQPATDGQGPALAVVDASANPENWGLPANWKATEAAYGSPTLSDADGDGTADFYELQAGTDPYSASSKPGFGEIRLDAGSVRLGWRAKAGRQYTILTADTLAGPWSALRDFPAQASDQAQSFNDPRTLLAKRFYRLQIRR